MTTREIDFHGSFATKNCSRWSHGALEGLPETPASMDDYETIGIPGDDVRRLSDGRTVV